MKNIPVVIVDDTEADRYIAKRMLNDAGGFAPILEVATGYEFLNQFLEDIEKHEMSDQKIVILMDINMPRIDGFETIEKLEVRMQNGTAPDYLAIMMFSSSDNPHDRARALKYPLIKGYIVKPLDEEGIETIRAAHS